MHNKVLLVKDVEGLGRAGDLVQARTGYIRNYLLPQGCALVATKQALMLQAKLKEARRIQAEKDRQESEVAAVRLAEILLSCSVKVDGQGHMYGSVSAQNIAELLQEQAGIEIEKRFIQLKHPIKELGEHVIQIKLKEGVSAQVRLSVLVEGQTAVVQGEGA